MDANQLLHYLRGFFELVDTPTEAQIRSIRNEVLQAKPAVSELAAFVQPRNSGNCGGHTEPYIDRNKFPM